MIRKREFLSAFIQCLSLLFLFSLNLEKQLAYKTLSVPECSPRSRLWFIFDHELILPEYLIYFEYIERVTIVVLFFLFVSYIFNMC